MGTFEEWSEPEGPEDAGRRRWPIGVRIALALVAVIGLGGAIALYFVISSLWESWTDPFGIPSPEHFEATEAHREALFTYDDLLEAFEGAPAVSEPQRMHAQDELRGWYLNYKAGAADGPGAYVSCALEVEGSVDLGRQQYGIWWEMAGFDDRQRILPRLSVTPLELEWGDDAVAGVLLRGDEPIGNAVVARRGERVVWLEWTGVAATDAEHLRNVVVPSLDRMVALRR